MITAEFLKSCTDEQINKGVAWLDAKNLSYFRCWNGDLFIDFQARYSPCTNPNDAWPIIKSERINLISPPEHRHEWKACATIGGGNWSLNDFTATSENPLRAAMEVYILMSTQS